MSRWRGGQGSEERKGRGRRKTPVWVGEVAGQESHDKSNWKKRLGLRGMDTGTTPNRS